MKPKLIFHAFWASIFALILLSCSRPSRPTPEGTATIIAEYVTITIFPSLAFTQNPNLESTLYPTLPFTKTATEAPTLTNTYQPTTTPYATVTPVPTVIPTITPTFDAYHLRDATRSPAEACPEVKTDVKPPDFSALEKKHYQQDYLDYFNNGGLAGNLPAAWEPEYTIDLTNDGVTEYIFKDMDVFILGCHEGNFEVLLNAQAADDNGANFVYEIRDANNNGIPEIILSKKLTELAKSFDVVEWNGTQFQSLLVPGDRHITINGVFTGLKSTDLKFIDMDSDPLFELAAFLYPPYFDQSYLDGFPWRNEVDYYKWNGNSYIYTKQVYDPPLFRFQAVHDGDRAFLRGEYDQAIKYYQLAIKDDDLYWYTEERRTFLLVYDPMTNLRNVTPTKPAYDPDEYPNLSAYSYFRMMLAEIKRGHPSGAQTIYDWLQANFTQAMPGYVFVDLATLFWDEYQKSHDFALSCSSTYDYTSTHPEEVFRYLTTQIAINKKLITWPDPIHFGFQSAELEYSPGMICPSQ